jgi:hypothetical protein
MEHFLKALFDGKNPEEAHTEFIKFGKGKYENKYLLQAKKQKDKWSIKTSAEFANYLVKRCLENVTHPITVKGIIIATFDISKDITFPIENIKKYMGIQQLVINGNVNPKEIIALMNKYPRLFYGLSFATSEHELKIKPKAPKSGKPATGGEKEVTADFCSLKTSNREIVKDLLFDVSDFNEVHIKHILMINEIILPKGVNDPVQIREQSKRKGAMERIIITDGSEKRSKADFFV